MTHTTPDTSNGSPYDRGAADSYYRRSYAPHYWPEGTYKGQQVTQEDMTPQQVREYEMGWDNNERDGDFKDYG